MIVAYTLPDPLGRTMAGDAERRATRDAQAPTQTMRRTAEGITITDYDPTTAPTAKEILRHR